MRGVLLAALLLALAPLGAAAADEDYEPVPQSEVDQLFNQNKPEQLPGHSLSSECWMLPCTQPSIDAYEKAVQQPGAFESAHQAVHDLIRRDVADQNDPQRKQEVYSLIDASKKVLFSVIDNYRGAQTPGPAGQAQQAAAAKLRQDASQVLKNTDVAGTKAEAILMAADKKGGMYQAIKGPANSPAERERIRQQYPNSPPILNQVANDMLRNGDPRGAYTTFNKALSLEPGNSDALTGRAAANMDLKNYKDAAVDAKEALRYNPKDPAAQAIVKLAHDKAADGFSAKAEDFGRSPAAGSSGEGAVSSGGAAAARAGLNTADGSSLQSSAYMRQAKRDLSLGDVNAAIQSADRAVQLDPRSADALSLRAFAEARAGHYAEALKDSVAALALDPNNVLAHNARAKALNSLGMFHEGLAAANDALRADKGNAYAEYMRAMAYNGMGDREQTLLALEKAARLDPRYRDAAELAKVLPAEKDLAFLFPEENLAQAKALLAAQAAGTAPPLKITLSMWVGGALIFGGLFHWLIWLPLSALAAKARRTGPALGTNATIGGLAFPGVPSVVTGVVLGGQYRRLGQMGSSVHGAVYEGMDLTLERPVAIRKLRAEMRAADRERLLAPARQAAALNHPHIASLYAVLDEEEALYLISEFAKGRALRDILASRGPLSAEEALPLFKGIAAAVDYAHSRGVVHGAIRASNIVISQEGRGKLVDFGLAHGPADRAADVAAFSACLREAIAGLAPAVLDAIDAALARERASLATAGRVVETVAAALQSSHS